MEKVVWRDSWSRSGSRGQVCMEDRIQHVERVRDAKEPIPETVDRYNGDAVASLDLLGAGEVLMEQPEVIVRRSDEQTPPLVDVIRFSVRGVGNPEGDSLLGEFILDYAVVRVEHSIHLVLSLPLIS